MSLLPSRSASMLIAGLCLAFSLALQIQLTLFKSDTYLGLRINAGDILVALASPAALWTLWRRQTILPQWPVLRFYIWPFVLAACLALGLLNTYISYGQITNWGLVNKLFGWFILTALFFAGGWIGSNATERHLRIMFRGMFGLFIVVALLQSIMMILHGMDATRPLVAARLYDFYPMAGLMANRNAFGLYSLAIISFLTVFHFSERPILPVWATNLFYAFLPFLVGYNGSRTVLGAVIIVTAGLFIYGRHDWKKVAMLGLCTLAGLVCFKLAPMQDGLAEYLYNEKGFAVLEKMTSVTGDASTESLPAELNYSGDSTRVKILKQALEMLRQHPVIGSGLGSVMLEQQRQNGKMLDLIDCAPLWILVEMGVIGLLLFALFFADVVRSLFAKFSQGQDDFARAFTVALLFTILGFALMCVLHEITYTRHMWFLIGIGLTLPARMRQDV